MGAALVAEALVDRSAGQMFDGSDAKLSPAERFAFDFLLRQRPAPGGPAVDWAAPPLAVEEAAASVPPWVPRVDLYGGVIHAARPADHAGAVCGPDGLPVHEPDGSIGYYVGQLKGLCLRAEIGGFPWREGIGAPSDPEADEYPVLPTQRPGGGRSGRPTILDGGAILRILMRLIEASRPPGVICLSEARCLTLVLWLNRLLTEDPGPASGDEHPYVFFERPEPKPSVLPVLKEVEPYLVTGVSVAQVAKKLGDRARCRNGEYADRG
jgi:hypothetical protein